MISLKLNIRKLSSVREDTQKSIVYFSGLTTKRGRGWCPDLSGSTFKKNLSFGVSPKKNLTERV